MTSFTTPFDVNKSISSLNDRYGQSQLDTFRECRPFQDWYTEFQSDPNNEKYSLEKVILTDLDMFGPRVGFCKFTAVIKEKKTGIHLPGITVLRGPSVAILVIINCSDNPHLPKKVLLTKQFRTPVAKEVIEVPAGMLDTSNNICSKALEELKEETGINVGVDDLVNLTERSGMSKGILMSPGLLDERIHLFSTKIDLTESQIKQLEKEERGEKDEGEIIHLTTIDLDKAHTIPDAKILSLLLLNQIYNGQ